MIQRCKLAPEVESVQPYLFQPLLALFVSAFVSLICFRLMKMISFKYKIRSCASKFFLALQAVQWNISGWC